MSDTGAIVVMMGIFIGAITCIFVGPMFTMWLFYFIKYLADKENV